MIYFFLVSFIVFVIVDYVYIYSFFDSKLFFNKSGSKLEYLMNLNNSKLKTKKLCTILSSRDVFFNLLNLVIFLAIMVILSIIIFNNVIFSKFVLIDLGYKKIELNSCFGLYWDSFKKIYYLVYVFFLVISYWYVLGKIKKYLINKRNIEEEDNCENNNDSILIGKNQDKNVYIQRKELYKNVLITGSIGTGKTSGAINTFCRYMIQNNISGLIIDIKGNYVSKVKQFINSNNRVEVLVVGDGSNIGYNPIRMDISCLEMANRLRRVIELISISNSSDSYWLDKVENVLCNMLMVIKYCDNKMDLNEIHRLITDNDYLIQKINKIKELAIIKGREDKIAHEIRNIIVFFENEYFKLDNRISTIIKSEITRLTIPFVTEYDVYSRFGNSDNDNVRIKFDYNKPKIIIFSMNMSHNYLLTKILATFIKLDFQSEILQKINNPVETFCICDEYQEIVNMQDAHFLSLSREAQCINILSMQSYSSLINVLKNEYTANVIIQNLVNKIWFRNDDNYTVQEIVKQIGQERKKFITSSISEGAQETKKSIVKGFKNKKSNISKTISYAENNDNIINSKVITQELNTCEALVLFGSNGNMEKIQKVKFK